MSSRHGLPPKIRQRLIFFVMVFLLAGSVRLLTFNFLRSHLNDANWFQYGTYGLFDKRAKAILDGSERMFWIDDPSRTDLVFFPPGYPLVIAGIYYLTGDRSAYSVQSVQAVLDLVLSMILITGVTVTAYGWRPAMAASVMVALSPLLALVGVSPFADAPTTWFVIGGLWLLLIAAKRNSSWWALAAGIVLGGGCWLRLNPLYLCVFWALPLFIFARTKWVTSAQMSAAVVLGTVLVISPIVVRNYLVFPEFILTGAGIGANLWEGLGETELGRSNGFMFGDDKLVEHERIKMQLAADFPMDAVWPDGIKRDRERTREALAFIAQHPVWYAGVMLRRMWGMIKTAGEPLPYYGTSGINVTSRKCLPSTWQGGIITFAVNFLGSLQSISRYVLLPLWVIGLGLAWRRERLMTVLFFATIFYYLVPGTFVHPEIRFALTMHWLLPIFAGITLAALVEQFSIRWRASREGVAVPAR